MILGATERVRVSDPSASFLEVNVPEVLDIRSEFIYNFHVPDERIRGTELKARLQDTPRYVDVSWAMPVLSEFFLRKIDPTSKVNLPSIASASFAGKIHSEDSFFNPGYVTHTFSSVSSVEQGSIDLENYSRLSGVGTESLFQMSQNLSVSMTSGTIKVSRTSSGQAGQINSISEFQLKNDFMQAYQTLADFPKDSLGLRVFDKGAGKAVDDEELLRSIANSVSLDVSVNAAVIPDVFENTTVTGDSSTHKLLSDVYDAYLKRNIGNSENLGVDPVYTRDVTDEKVGYASGPVRLIGYIIDRYEANQTGFIKEKTYYVEDITTTLFQDADVLYGKTYVYTVRVIADVEVLSYDGNGRSIKYSSLYVSSRAVSTAIETYEYVPPPPPDYVEFTFDYDRRNLILTWRMPVNPQRDVKQYQVFRRKSINHPFELIAQIGFDDSKPVFVNGKLSRYKTGEAVDANNVEGMNPDLLKLVKLYDRSISSYVDEDFTVDAEQLVSSEYIYTVCSVDAHGMISNYSNQYHVVFDLYKNKLNVQVVCRSGSPRQYPNMNIVEDAFKDVIRVEGDVGRKMTLYCTPEYLALQSGGGKKFNVMEVQTGDVGDKKPVYLFQFINLDNQKMQLLSVDVKDSTGISTRVSGGPAYTAVASPKPAASFYSMHLDDS